MAVNYNIQTPTFVWCSMDLKYLEWKGICCLGINIGINNAVVHGYPCQINIAADTEFLIEAMTIGADGFGAKAKLVGDRL